MILPLLMVSLGLCFVVGAIVCKLGSLRSAADPREKAYWRWGIAANALFAYGLAVLGLLAADILRGEPWGLSERWPALSVVWYGTGNRVVAVLLDVLTAMLASLASMGAALWFGYVDESDVWHPVSRMESRARLRKQARRGQGAARDGASGDRQAREDA